MAVAAEGDRLEAAEEGGDVAAEELDGEPFLALAEGEAGDELDEV
jgi:hypothetical protein